MRLLDFTAAPATVPSWPDADNPTCWVCHSVAAPGGAVVNNRSNVHKIGGESPI
jgi:hypothetical protein